VTNSDLFVAAVEEARAGTSPDCPTGGVDALLQCAPDWSPVRLAHECATLAAEVSGAAQSALYAAESETMDCVALWPPHLESPLAIAQDMDTFPWDIGPLMASRFVLVEDASTLAASIPSSTGRTLGDLGFTSAVHLPLWAGNRLMGALHLYWDDHVTTWDDRSGALLRAIGVFTLDRMSRSDGRSETAHLEHRT
jgi:hypothetical protein